MTLSRHRKPAQFLTLASAALSLPLLCPSLSAQGAPPAEKKRSPVESRGYVGELKGKYKMPVIDARLFGQLSMINSERDDYAANLAAYAISHVQLHKGSQESLDLARQVLGLALHLSPRNKKCIVANAQLNRDVMPETITADYEPTVFAKILHTRGLLLEKQPNEVNSLVARYFIDLASRIDPRNEDAIYESELRRIDHGDIDWTKVTDAKKPQPATVPLK